MNFRDIPVVTVGPGSQPAEPDGQALSYIDMPGDMAKYRPPPMPDPEEVEHLSGARQTMDWLRGALAACGENGVPLVANLNSLDEASRDLVNQVLGEGEVGITYSGNLRARTQESVLAGVWRTLYFDDDGSIGYDLLEVGDVPHLVRIPAGNRRPVNASAEGAPDDVANALPILVELESRVARYERDGTTHAVNLTLLPLSEAELEFIDRRLGRGPVDMLSRAYGKCQIISTLTPNLWWVRYYNSMGTLILNTLEIVDVPLVARAAPEDLRDSRTRLEEILAPYWSEVASTT